MLNFLRSFKGEQMYTPPVGTLPVQQPQQKPKVVLKINGKEIPVDRIKPASADDVSKMNDAAKDALAEWRRKYGQWQASKKAS